MVIPFGVISSSKAAPAPSCSITLEAPGVLGAFGTSALEIDGQRLFKTLSSESSSRYTASTPNSSPITVDWSGRRAIEFAENEFIDFADVDVGVMPDGFSTPAESDIWRWDESASTWEARDNTNTVIASVAGASTDTVALVIAGDGTVEWWHNGTKQVEQQDLAANQDIYIYKAANTAAATIPSGASTTTTVNSAGSNMGYSYNSADDWCGNAI